MAKVGFIGIVFLLSLLLASPRPAPAAEVTMAFGERIPPFCFPHDDSGIEVEVIREALAARGHVLKPSYYPLARVPIAFRSGEVDAAMTDLGQDLRPFGAHHGDPAVLYDNVFITLKSREIKIRQPADLLGLQVMSFQGAAQRYPEWLGPLRAGGRYREINDQVTQVRTLMLGRTDAVLSDRSIFRYFVLQLKKQGVSVAPYEEHVFTTANPMDYRPVFRDPQVRDDFNLGLKRLKASGRYQAIFDKYLKE
jgi:polar amino acid transport system substrate-binding protein